MGSPPNKKGGLYDKKASKRFGDLGDPMAPTKGNKERGILRLLDS